MSILFVRNQMVRVLHSLFPPPCMLTQYLGYLVPSNGSVIVKHLDRLVQRKSTRWAPLVGRMIRLQTDMGVWSQNRVMFLRFNHHLSISALSSIVLSELDSSHFLLNPSLVEGVLLVSLACWRYFNPKLVFMSLTTSPSQISSTSSSSRPNSNSVELYCY